MRTFMSKEDAQNSIFPGDKIFINSDSWRDNGPCVVKSIEFSSLSTQVKIKTTDGHDISTAWHFIEKID